MLMLMALFGTLTACVGAYITLDNRRVHKEKLARIQREIALREAANAKIETAETEE